MSRTAKQNSIIHFNKVIWLLTISDIFNWGVYTVVTGIAAIYLSGKLGENTLQYIGVGVGIYSVARALFQLPVGVISDRLKSDRDEILFLVAGNFFMGLPYLFYPAINGPELYFVLQLIFGVGAAINLNSWRKLFARNLDDGQEGKEYALYELIMSGATAIFAVIAGSLASISRESFDQVMIATGIIMLSGCVWPVLIFRIKKRNSNSKKKK